MILIMITTVLIGMPALVQAQANLATSQIHGGTPQHPVTGGPTPTGVTPSFTVTTTGYLSFTPNPIGVNQLLLVNIWQEPATNVNRAHTGYTVKMTKPDGSTVTIGPLNSYDGDTTAWFNYVPDQVGTWQIQYIFPGDYYPAGYYLNGVDYGLNKSAVPPQPATAFGETAPTYFAQDCYYAPCQSPVENLTVQQNYVVSWPASPLPGPGDYWTRPINPNNREWWTIAGNFPFSGLGGGTNWPADTNTYESNYNFLPYTQAPTSAHVVWRTQVAVLGLLGGQGADLATSVQSEDYPNIMFQGRGYMSYTNVYDGTEQEVWQCYNIQTGQVYWTKYNITQVPTAITYNSAIYSFQAPPVPGSELGAEEAGGILVAIGGGQLTFFDPTTGNQILSYSIPVSSGTLYDDPYVLSVQNLGHSHYALINWTLNTESSNFEDRVISNITFPFSSLGTVDYETGISCRVATISPPQAIIDYGTNVSAASLVTGQLLWTENITDTISGSPAMADHGILAFACQLRHWDAFNEQTGALVWTSDLLPYPWGFAWGYGDSSGYGNIYGECYCGEVAINWTTGHIDWLYQDPTVPFETPYGGFYSNQGVSLVADGMVFTYELEHTPTAPFTRGWKYLALNATDGSLIWSLYGSGIDARVFPGAISDGYLNVFNGMDGYLYGIGMGQSTTTVSAPQTTMSQGSSAVIQGSVMDDSPAASTSMHYAPGQPVPCVSDASMTIWMQYLYMQAPIGGLFNNETITGVPVTISAVDPNNQTVNLGTVTTDGTSGTFALNWTPTIPGLYKIYASFAGDDSYSSSFATTYATVSVPPSATPTPTPTASPATNIATQTELMTYLVAGVIAIIIAIAIVGFLILRKRP